MSYSIILTDFRKCKHANMQNGSLLTVKIRFILLEKLHPFS